MNPNPPKPTWNDAWLLAAIHMGQGNAKDAVGWADHINATCAIDDEWFHAFEVLGRLGLISDGDPFPRSSPLGEEIFRKCAAPDLGARMYPKLILEEIVGLPYVGEPIRFRPDLVREAERSHGEAMKEAVAKSIAEWKAEHPS